MFPSIRILPLACTLAIAVYKRQFIWSNTYGKVKDWISHELGRLKREAPPTDFILKIESFSTLSSSSLERYESPEFEAAGTKWKLAIYPNGNEARDGKDHISLYLVLADKSKKEILVTYRLFMFDHIRNKYLTDESVGRFNEVKSEYGFDQFLPLRVLKDASSGYLNNDTCWFGAEVFLIQHTNKFKHLSMVAVKSNPFRYRWKINAFQSLENRAYFSDKFTVWGYDWKLMLYPKGNQRGKGTCISLYLTMDSSGTTNLPPEKQAIVEYELRLVNQLNKGNIEVRDTASLGSIRGRGSDCFFRSTKLKDTSNGFLVDDSIIVEADLIVLGSISNCV